MFNCARVFSFFFSLKKLMSGLTHRFRAMGRWELLVSTSTISHTIHHCITCAEFRNPFFPHSILVAFTTYATSSYIHVYINTYKYIFWNRKY